MNTAQNPIHNLTTRLFEGHAVRIFGTPEAPWFGANDVCAVFDLKNPRDVTAGLPDDVKGLFLTDTPGGAQQITVLNEEGLYTLIFRSRKESAKRFQKWILTEVLPSLRRTGTYSVPGAREPGLEGLDRFTGAVETLASILGPAVDAMERMAAANSQATGGKETWPDCYHAPQLALNEVVTLFRGETRARFRSLIMEARSLSRAVVDDMIDAAVGKGWLAEDTKGVRLSLRSTALAVNLWNEEIGRRKMLLDEMREMEGRGDGH